MVSGAIAAHYGAMTRTFGTLILVLFCLESMAFLRPFLRTRKAGPVQVNCETGTPVIGDTCIGGAIYAGTFPVASGTRYMILPGGCAGGTSNPTCSGTDTTATKVKWAVTGASGVPSIDTVDLANQTSAQLGDFNQPKIVSYASSSGYAHAAAAYCDNMVFGGYADWYLPSKSELGYVLCKSQIGSPSASYPQENPNCTSYGTKTSQLKGWAADYYWSSTQSAGNSVQAWAEQFVGGFQSTFGKTTSYYVRCVRRF